MSVTGFNRKRRELEFKKEEDEKAEGKTKKETSKSKGDQ